MVYHLDFYDAIKLDELIDFLIKSVSSGGDEETNYSKSGSLL